MQADIILLPIPTPQGRPGLTPRQEQVLAVIRAWREINGYPPSVVNVMRATGILSPNGVMCHMRALRKKGYIRFTDGLARTTVIVEAV